MAAAVAQPNQGDAVPGGAAALVAGPGRNVAQPNQGDAVMPPALGAAAAGNVAQPNQGEAAAPALVAGPGNVAQPNQGDAVMPPALGAAAAGNVAQPNQGEAAAPALAAGAQEGAGAGLNAIALAMIAGVGEGNVDDVLPIGQGIMLDCGFAPGSDITSLELYLSKDVQKLGATYFRVHGVNPTTGEEFVETGLRTGGLIDLASRMGINYSLIPLYFHHPRGRYAMHVADVYGFRNPDGESLGVITTGRKNDYWNLRVHDSKGQYYTSIPMACASIPGAPSVTCIAEAQHVNEMNAGRAQGLPPGTTYKVDDNGFVHLYTLPPIAADNEHGFDIFSDTLDNVLSAVPLLIGNDELWSVVNGLRKSLGQLLSLTLPQTHPGLIRVFTDWSNDETNHVYSMNGTVAWIRSGRLLSGMKKLKKLTLCHFIWQWNTTRSLIVTEFGLTEQQAVQLSSDLAQPIANAGRPPV